MLESIPESESESESLISAIPESIPESRYFGPAWNRLELKELATAILETDEQIDAADSISFIENLIQALFLQVIIWSAIRQAIFCESVDSLKFLFILDRDSVILDKDSDSILNKDSDSRFLCLSESAFHSLTDKITNKFFKAQIQSWSVVSLIQNAQELDLQYKQIINWFHVCTQQCIMLTLQSWFLS